MTKETRNCQNCKASFTIEPEDFVFYEKIKVPPPTFCPQCRLVRRLAWFKGFRLYKRPCDLCKKEKISMYRPDAPYTIYCNECWWSDAWDPTQYGRDYDFSRPFFEQFNELLHTVPIRGLAIDTMSGELSAHEYNDTFAHMFHPRAREEVFAAGLRWIDDLASEYKTTKQPGDLPDHIRDVDDQILNDIIQCKTCPRGYRVTKQELRFLQHHNFPLPRQCPFCRIEEKVQRWVWQMTLVERTCDKCGKIFRTNYRKEDAPVVYCKECYRADFF